MAKPRDRYIYYPDCRRGARIGSGQHPQPLATRSRPRWTSTTPEAAGVLFSHGARFGGHSLYVKDGKLKYVYNFVGEQEQMIDSAEPTPTGKVLLSAAFVRENNELPTLGNADALHQR